MGDTYVESNCYEGEVTTPNPAKDATLGFGGILFLVGLIASVVSGGVSTERKTRPDPSPPQYVLEVSGEVVEADSNDNTTLTMRIRSDNVDQAAEQFKESALEDGYVLKGDPSVEVVSQTGTDKSGVPSATETTRKTGSERTTLFDAPINELLADRLGRVDSHRWETALKTATGIWAVNYLVPASWIPFDPLFGFLIFVSWIALPVSLYMDSKYIDPDKEWQMKRSLLAGIALLPLLNVLVGGLYLVRRHYVLTGREFTLGVVSDDLQRRAKRLRMILEEKL